MFSDFFGVVRHGLLTAGQRQELRVGVQGRLAALVQDPVPIPANQTTLVRNFKILPSEVFWQLE